MMATHQAQDNAWASNVFSQCFKNSPLPWRTVVIVPIFLKSKFVCIVNLNPHAQFFFLKRIVFELYDTR